MPVKLLDAKNAAIYLGISDREFEKYTYKSQILYTMKGLNRVYNPKALDLFKKDVLDKEKKL